MISLFFISKNQSLRQNNTIKSKADPKLLFAGVYVICVFDCMVCAVKDMCGVMGDCAYMCPKQNQGRNRSSKWVWYGVCLCAYYSFDPKPWPNIITLTFPWHHKKQTTIEIWHSVDVCDCGVCLREGMLIQCAHVCVNEDFIIIQLRQSQNDIKKSQTKEKKMSSFLRWLWPCSPHIAPEWPRG